MMLHPIVKKLCDFKYLKIGQNLHANMGSFRRASHKYVFVFSMMIPGVCVHDDVFTDTVEY